MAAAAIGLWGWTPAARADDSYVETPRPRAWYTLLKPAYSNPADQLRHARALRDAGRTWRAQRHYRALYESWPVSIESGQALLERAEMLARNGHIEDAFENYQQLADHPASPLSYKDNLDRQSELAAAAVTRKHYRLLFGGWATPERAVPMLEALARTAAGWPGAERAQIEIGRIHARNANWTDSASAFQEYLIRFSTGPNVEEAAYGRARALHELARDDRNDPAVRRDAWSALSAFTRDYPESGQRADALQRLERMTEAQIEEAWRIARHYDRNHRSPEAARLAMERFLTLYPATPHTTFAQARLNFYERKSRQQAISADKEKLREPPSKES